MADLVMTASTFLAVLFTVAWALVPGLRAWLERPKHRFHETLLRYDRQQASGSGRAGSEP
jgi:hypothetical protein